MDSSLSFRVPVCSHFLLLHVQSLLPFSGPADLQQLQAYAEATALNKTSSPASTTIQGLILITKPRFHITHSGSTSLMKPSMIQDPNSLLKFKLYLFIYFVHFFFLFF